MNMKDILNGHALKSLLKNIDTPNVNLGVGTDEKHSSVPILLFTEHHLPVAKPEIQPLNQMSHEKVQKPGAGVVLSLEDFETENFNMGTPYGGDA